MSATRPARQRGRPRSLQSEQAIMNATLQLLLKLGYAGLTIDRVAAAARASKATIYRRWPSKELLILAAFSQLPAVAPADNGDFIADLLDLHRQYLRIMQAPLLRSVVPMLAAECVQNPELANAMEAFNEQRRVPLRIVFARAIRRGQLPPDTDIELGIDALQGVLMVRTYLMHGEVDEAWARSLFAFVQRGLGSPSAPGRITKR